MNETAARQESPASQMIARIFAMRGMAAAIGEKNTADTLGDALEILRLLSQRVVQLIAERDEFKAAWLRRLDANQRMREALKPFEHMRIVFGDHENDAEIYDVIDGHSVTVGYPRNREIADQWNRNFEMIRETLVKVKEP